MSKTYDVPPEKQAVILENAKRRMELRQYFLKETSNPFRHATGEGGYLFDPAMQRYQALKVTEYERFKPNLKTAKYGFWYLVLPFTLLTYAVYKERENKEGKFRRGEVAYKDRQFKFI